MCRITFILDQYQEQSNILDSILEEFVAPLITFVKKFVLKCVANKDYKNGNEVKQIFAVLGHIIKVRGYKTVIKFFPHEVSDMEPVTEMLQNCDYSQVMLPYTLVLWLSIIVLVPFDLTSIDSVNQQNQVILVNRIINLAT